MKKYINEYINKKMNTKFTAVSIYIPKKNGKPCVEKGYRWYVYFYRKNDDGTYKQYKFYHGINRYKTYAERLKVANILKEAIEKYLELGNDPFLISYEQLLKDAIIQAFENKKKEWGKTTLRVNSTYKKSFLEWIDKKGLSNYPVNDIKKKHLMAYLNEVSQNKSPTTINNHIRFLSMIFGKMAQDDVIQTNIARDIKKLKILPIKNEYYTKDEYYRIAKYLKENDPYLLTFIRFMGYTFLRPIEIIRLKVKDINLEEKTIKIQTKTEKKSIIKIIDKLYDTLKDMEIQKYEPEHFVFTKYNRPGFWKDAKNEQVRYYYFRDRFSKHKKKMNLKKTQSIYSFRHTFARMLYFKFLDEGMTDLEAKFKLMTITRHKSISSLNYYLRSIGAFLPDDFSNDLDI